MFFKILQNITLVLTLCLLSVGTAFGQTQTEPREVVFVAQPDVGTDTHAGKVEFFKVSQNKVFDASGVEHTEFILEVVISKVEQNPNFADSFTFVLNHGGLATQGDLPVFHCYRNQCQLTSYDPQNPQPGFIAPGKTHISSSSNANDASEWEVRFTTNSAPHKEASHFYVRYKNFDEILTLYPKTDFAKTDVLGIWFHQGTNTTVEQDADGYFTKFDRVHIGWYDSVGIPTHEEPGTIKCDDTTPLVFNFDDLKHRQLVPVDRYKENFLVRGEDHSGNAIKVVAVDTGKLGVGNHLGTPSIPYGPGASAPTGGIPGVANKKAQNIALMLTTQADNGSGYVDFIIPAEGILIFDFINSTNKKATLVKSFVGIDAGDDNKSFYTGTKDGKNVFKTLITNEGAGSVITYNMDLPDSGAKTLDWIGIYNYSHAAFDDLAVCTDCLEKDRDYCGVCNGPGSDVCHRCPGDEGYGEDPGKCGCDKTPDQCGLCPGDAGYGEEAGKCGCGKKPDDCGLCPGDPNYGTGKDACGMCGGNGQDDCGLCPGEPGYGDPPLECGCPNSPDYKPADECGCPNDPDYKPADECGCPNDPDYQAPEFCGCPNDPEYKPVDECGECGGPGRDDCGRCRKDPVTGEVDPNYGNVDCDPCPEGQKRDECGICGGLGKNDCGYCPGHPDENKPCDEDCPQGYDLCNVCGGNNDCCGTENFTALQTVIDSRLHLMVNNYNTLKRRYARRATGKKQKDFIRQSTEIVEGAMLAGWTGTWGITSEQTFCEGVAQGACVEVSNAGNLAQIMDSANIIKDQAEIMMKRIAKKLKRKKPRPNDRKIYQVLWQKHMPDVETNVSSLPKVTQNCSQ